MWFVVKTPFGEEERSKDLVLSKIHLVRDAYIPMQQIASKNALGLKTFTQKPLLNGYMFVDLRVEIDETAATDEERSFSQKVWSKLKKSVTARGYFFYRDSETKKIDFLPNIRFLSSSYKNTIPELFITQSHIPDCDMIPFIRYQESEKDEFLDKVEILDKSFEALTQEHDTVRVVSGPLKDVVGAIVQKRQEGNKKYKDRHLEVRFGKCMCISYPNIRRFDMVVIREAKESARTRELRLWQEADYLIGLLQRNGFPKDADKAKDAPAFLKEKVDEIREDIKDFRTNNIKKGHPESVYELLGSLKKELKSEELVRRLFYFANDLPLNVSGSNNNEVYKRYIPHFPIRPFLTPAEGEETYHKAQVVEHHDHGFKELIIPINLKPYFVAIEDEDKDSYDYNAHVAVFPVGEHPGQMIVSWGHFYETYASLDQQQKKGFLEDLKLRGYDKMYALLTAGHPKDDAQDSQSAQITFGKVNGIGGFSLNYATGEDIVLTAQKLVNAVAPAAVEFWQRERLRNWRILLQQSVFVRKQLPRS